MRYDWRTNAGAAANARSRAASRSFVGGKGAGLTVSCNTAYARCFQSASLSSLKVCPARSSPHKNQSARISSRCLSVIHNHTTDCTGGFDETDRTLDHERRVTARNCFALAAQGFARFRSFEVSHSIAARFFKRARVRARGSGWLLGGLTPTP